MLIGIDVGDAVAVDQEKIIVSVKIPTTENIVLCICDALKKISAQVPSHYWGRLVISTTMLTNVVAQNKFERVGLIIIPGPGLNPNIFSFPEKTCFLKGAINYRGHL